MQIRFAIQTMCASVCSKVSANLPTCVWLCVCVRVCICMRVCRNVCMCKMASLLGAPRSVLHCSLSHFPFFSFQNFPFSSGIFCIIFSAFHLVFFWLNCFIRHVRKFSNEQQCNLGRGSAASLLLLLRLLLLLTPWVTVSVTDSCCCCCCCCSLLSKAGEVVLLLSLSSPSLPSSPSFLPFIPSFFLFCPAQPRRQFDKRIFAGSTKWTCISYCMSVCVC